MLTLVHDDDASNAGVADGGRSLIDEIVREGARQMLAAALAAEVAAYIDQFADQLDEQGHRLVVRNGFHNERDVLTAAGSITVKASRVKDKRVDPDTGKRHRFSGEPVPLLGAPKIPLRTRRSGQIGESRIDFGIVRCWRSHSQTH
jgi:putative transposase